MTTAQQKSLFAGTANKPTWELDDQADRLFAEVVFNHAVDQRFLYEVPYPLRDRIAPGKRVRVPFGRRNRIVPGYCVRLVDWANRGDLKRVQDVLDEEVLLGPQMLALAQWIAEQYCCTYGQVLDAMLPAGVKSGARTREQILLQLAPGARAAMPELRLSSKQRRVVEILAEAGEPISPVDLARAAGCTLGPISALRHRLVLEPVRRSAMPSEQRPEPIEPPEPFELNAKQRQVLNRIQDQIQVGGFHPMLLHGVTGSGKTEVYLLAIEQIVRAGREAIVLVPEISLTPQTIRQFRGRFARVAVLHSHLPAAQRHAQWRRIAAGEADVVIGARSAIFAPTKRLGLILLDEEHEGTYKQEITPRYHAREVAWRRGELEQVPLLLGSATPSMESWHRVQMGRCELLELPERVRNLPLPEVKLIDLRSEQMAKRARGPISPPLEQAIRQALEADGQVILLLNRRGYSTHIHCYRCGHVEKCPRCDIALVYHRDRRAAVCHFCDLQLAPPERCPQCRDMGLNYRGMGTERLEQEVRARFPGYPCHRMDTDSMRRTGSHERVLGAFRRGELRILLGTQMIAKGLDFPGVTLVGVVNADIALHLPDFRATERTFQLVAQVAGRTGRGEQPGRVLVQTFSPDHAAIQAAAQHDFHRFAAAELPLRQAHGYPPLGRMARIIVRSPQEHAARQHAELIASRLRQQADQAAESFRILGPAPAPISRVRNYYRYHLQLQGPEDQPLHPLIRPVLASTPAPHRVEMAVDVDPLSML